MPLRLICLEKKFAYCNSKISLSRFQILLYVDNFICGGMKECERYESLLEEKPTWPAKKTDVVEEANEIIDIVLEGLNVEENCEERRVQDVETAKKGEVSNVDFEPPTFSVGLTQMEESTDKGVVGEQKHEGKADITMEVLEEQSLNIGTDTLMEKSRPIVVD
ncbi:hypothetical protein L1987_00920 [Smallanthus sonchifolius]|uniref:Uncharacterized protein n=1 Tax=Smallanthus sonchifolius TaxID=185202 RepID=A0ACB9K3G7_9ASTR|nr:hypothetical protein L1987_00920 [Smallanthus sonchifolius]